MTDDPRDSEPTDGLDPESVDPDASTATDAAPITGQRLVESVPGDLADADVQILDRPGREAETVPAASVLERGLADGLGHELYTHQATALEALERGENVCVSTSTASGKTLVYALQIARQIRAARERGIESTAYVCYPTKALSRDQERELNEVFDRLGLDVDVGVYDGDTELGETRRQIRESADVIITNFAGVNTYLHDHDRWSRFFGACDLVVVDESHSYTGVHGMHVAWIIRRLKRVLESYGADPQFVLTSATVGNPGEHSSVLIDDPVTVIDEDGSPRGPRDVVIWNPPRRSTGDGPGASDWGDGTTPSDSGDGTAPSDSGDRDEPSDSGDRDAPSDSAEESELLGRVPATVEAPKLFSHLTYHGAQTLLFSPSRTLAEVSVERARRFRSDRRGTYTDPDRGSALEPYHAGHARERRHAIEHRLKNGLLDGVASTNALELGINVGQMDATVQLGYPGQRQSFWQQIGRAGRGTRRALSVLVAGHQTLDQYVASNPAYLLETDVEDAVVDVENDAVFASHLLCAADELALDDRDAGTFADRDRLERAVEMWRRAGRLSGHLETGVSYTGRPRPQSTISLYATGGTEYEVRLADDVDDSHDPEMEPVSKERAFRDFHEGAVRLHAGRQYEVRELIHDAPQPAVVVAPTNVDYYTASRTDVTILDAVSERSREVNGFRLHYGTATVLVYHGTYDKRSIHGGGAVERGIPTGLPPLEMETQCCWVEVPRRVERRLFERYGEYEVSGLDDGPFSEGDHVGYAGGLHAAEHATILVAPLELMVDKRDLGGLATLTIDAHLAGAGAEASTEDGGRIPGSFAAATATVEDRAATLDRPPASGWFVYDGVDGGLGFSRAIYDQFESIAERARSLVVDCDCGRVEGCPACVMDDQCGNDNQPLHREAAADVFDHLLGTADGDRGDVDSASADRARRPAAFYS